MKRAAQYNAARLAGLIMAGALLSACVRDGTLQVSLQKPLPLSLSAQSQATNPGLSALQGFAVFNEQSLTFLQQRALENNKDMQVALLRFAQSRLQRSTVAQQSQPQLNASGTTGAQRQSETGSATRVISAISPPEQSQNLIDFISEPFALYQAGFDASWELDLWGRVRSSVDVADARVALAQANIDQWQLGLTAEVARHYFELRGAQTQAQLVQQDLARNEQLLALLEVRERAGLDNAYDREQQQSLLADLRRKAAPLAEQQSRSLSALSLLLGEAPGSLDAELSSAQSWKVASLPDLAPGVPSDVVNKRPDIQASEARLREATAQIGIAEADLYPRITLGAGVGLESLESGDLLDWGSRQWSIGPRFYLPLFDQGRRKNNVQLRELQQQEAAIAFQQVVLSAWHEVDSAVSRYNAEQQQRDELRTKLAHQQQALSLAQASVRNGMSNALSALRLEQAVANVQSELIQSDTRLALNLVILLKALGRSEPFPSGPGR